MRIYELHPLRARSSLSFVIIFELYHRPSNHYVLRPDGKPYTAMCDWICDHVCLLFKEKRDPSLHDASMVIE
jgi:hypothetical protein